MRLAQAQDGNAKNISSVIASTYYLLMVVACSATFIGLWGLLLSCCKDRCLAITFGCMLTPSTVITIGLGFFLTTFSRATKEEIAAFCGDKNVDKEALDEVERWNSAQLFVKKVDFDLGEIISRKMCSQVCPCPKVENRAEWLTITNDDLVAYERTQEPISGSGLEPLDFSGRANKLYSTFEECFSDLRAGKTSEVNSEVKKYADAWNEGVFTLGTDFLKFFESQYECSNICSPSLFYYSLPLEKGRP